MNKQELIQEHKELHKSLDRLVACFIENNTINPSEVSVMELIEWSYKQTIDPVCAKKKQKVVNVD